MEIVFNALPHFPWKWFQLRHSKISKKLINAFFIRSLHSFLSSRLLQNHFLRRFLWPNFDLNSFESFVSLYQKTVSTLLLKNLQKIKKWHFQMFATFAFDLKVASKPSNLKSFDFLPHFPHLPHMVAEKFAKTWKMRFWNALEIE